MALFPDYLNWRNYVDVGEFCDPAQKQKIEKALNQMMLTKEEFKELASTVLGTERHNNKNTHPVATSHYSSKHPLFLLVDSGKSPLSLS